jgi:ribonuclease E
MTLDDENTQAQSQDVQRQAVQPEPGQPEPGQPEPGQPEPGQPEATAAARPRTRRRAASRPAGPPSGDDATAAAETSDVPADAEAGAAPRKRTRRAPTRAGLPADAASEPEPQAQAQAPGEVPGEAPTQAPVETPGDAPVEAAPRRRRARKAAAPTPARAANSADAEPTNQAPQIAVEEPAAAAPPSQAAEAQTEPGNDTVRVAGPPPIMPIFQAPEPVVAPRARRRAASRPAGPPQPPAESVRPAPTETPEETDDELEVTPVLDAGESGVADPTVAEDTDDIADDIADDLTDDRADRSDELEEDESDEDESDEGEEAAGESGRRRRRRRGGRGRRGRSRDQDADDDTAGGSADVTDVPDEAGTEDDEADAEDEDESAEGSTSRRRRRRRRRTGGGAEEPSPDDPPNTVVRVRESRRSSSGSSDVTSVKGSTRLEAKKMRRREGREAGRRRPLITEAEFLARRESVDRIMVVRELDGRTQIGVLEDGVLVEHYVARRTQTTMVGNVYLGRVQNVLPSMEAAFVDIGKGRNAVIYAGEVNWDAAGLEGQPKRIEHALKAGESVLVQVTKEPIGHKGARLTSQVSLPGRYLVYVPDGSMTGISRKLPDTERARLKKILRDVVPEDAGVIVRTAAEGASEEELQRDVARLQAQWEDISRKAGAVNAPALLYGEPDLAIRVVRDIFNEDFGRLVISGDDTWDTLQSYIGHVAPDLVDRLERWDGETDVFAHYRIDEQIAKALDRKVWLPSGGSLVIDRTEAMTVVDVNTGKFTGAGGNLEETVTRNNLEAAEEIVRQLRLRDIGGIIVVDFIDMVLESNRELVLRRLIECLGRDRTKHQVAEVTSLGLVQMTRKRVGQGLLEVFSETCETCGGRGIVLHDEPVEKRAGSDTGGRGRSSSGGSNGHSHGNAAGTGNDAEPVEEQPAEGSGGGGGGRSRRRRGGNRNNETALAEGA